MNHPQHFRRDGESCFRLSRLCARPAHLPESLWIVQEVEYTNLEISFRILVR